MARRVAEIAETVFGGRKTVFGGRKTVFGGRKTGSWLPGTGSWPPETGSWFPGTEIFFGSNIQEPKMRASNQEFHFSKSLVRLSIQGVGRLSRASISPRGWQLWRSHAEGSAAVAKPHKVSASHFRFCDREKERECRCCCCCCWSGDPSPKVYAGRPTAARSVACQAHLVVSCEVTPLPPPQQATPPPSAPRQLNPDSP